MFTRQGQRRKNPPRPVADTNLACTAWQGKQSATGDDMSTNPDDQIKDLPVEADKADDVKGVAWSSNNGSGGGRTSLGGGHEGGGIS
jgi:hypothetical protein